MKPDAFKLDTLAASYAEVGKFDEAISTQKKANALFKKAGLKKALSKGNEHLSSYQNKKPWRDDVVSSKKNSKP